MIGWDTPVYTLRFPRDSGFWKLGLETATQIQHTGSSCETIYRQLLFFHCLATLIERRRTAVHASGLVV